MGCLERDLSLHRCIACPPKRNKWTLAAKKSGEWFRRVEEAAELCMKRWFVKKRESVAKR